MVEQATQYRSRDPNFERFESALSDIRAESYRFGRSSKDNAASGNSVPLFLSDPDGEPEPDEYVAPFRKYRGSSVSLRILAAVLVAAGVAVVFAWYSSGSTGDIIANAKASIVAALPAQPAEAQPQPAQLTQNDMQLKDPTDVAAPPINQSAADAQVQNQVQLPPAVQAAAPGPMQANASPTREEIATAYQSAVQNRADAPTPPVTTPAVTKIDPDEFATLMKRAKEMLASGDIPPARLLLERAAEGQDPTPALLLAQTYDPQVLGTPDVRNIVPDSAKARRWYERAAQLGSADAQQRLAQMPN